MPADYRVVAEALRQQIRAGDLRPGDRVPGVRALAEEHDTNTDTAARALRLLEGEGWVVMAPRTVTRVAVSRPDEPPTAADLAALVADHEARIRALEEGRGPAGRG